MDFCPNEEPQNLHPGRICLPDFFVRHLLPFMRHCGTNRGWLKHWSRNARRVFNLSKGLKFTYDIYESEMSCVRERFALYAWGQGTCVESIPCLPSWALLPSPYPFMVSRGATTAPSLFPLLPPCFLFFLFSFSSFPLIGTFS